MGNLKDPTFKVDLEKDSSKCSEATVGFTVEAYGAKAKSAAGGAEMLPDKQLFWIQKMCQCENFPSRKTQKEESPMSLGCGLAGDGGRCSALGTVLSPLGELQPFGLN